MLVASPYIGLEPPHGVPPRVISEIKKPSPIFPRDHMRPRISGDLLVLCGPEEHWWPRRVMIRAGQLIVMSAPGAGGSGIRLPLRHLSISAGPLPNSVTLRKGIHFTPVLSLQATNEREFDLWVKTIAIELIRQTPLDAVKYFDILTLANCWTKPSHQDQTSTAANTAEEEDDLAWKAIFSDTRKCTTCYSNAKDSQETINEEDVVSQSQSQDEVDFNRNIVTETYTAKPIYKLEIAKSISCSSSSSSSSSSASTGPAEDVLVKVDPVNDKDAVDLLLKKCQNSENYVPVKEKLQLFESLCRLSRLVRSSEDLSGRIGGHVGAKRTQSMHDLSNCFPGSGVRKICQYFENKSEILSDTNKYNSMTRGNRSRRLINSDSQLNTVKTSYRFNEEERDISYV